MSSMDDEAYRIETQKVIKDTKDSISSNRSYRPFDRALLTGANVGC